MKKEKIIVKKPLFELGAVVEIKARWRITAIVEEPDGIVGYRLEHATNPRSAIMIAEARLRKPRT